MRLGLRFWSKIVVKKGVAYLNLFFGDFGLDNGVHYTLRKRHVLKTVALSLPGKKINGLETSRHRQLNVFPRHLPLFLSPPPNLPAKDSYNQDEQKAKQESAHRSGTRAQAGLTHVAKFNDLLCIAL